MRPAALAAVLALGCGQDPHAGTLTNLDGALSAGMGLEYVAAEGSVKLAYAGRGPYCYVLDERTRATVNGASLEAVSLGGGWFDGEAGGLGDMCTRPTWTVPSRPESEAQTRFEISDSSLTLQATFAAVGAARSMAAASPGAVRPGNDFALDWSPATDTPYVDLGNGSRMVWTFIRLDGGAEVFSPTRASSVPGRVTLGMPAIAAGSGSLAAVGRYFYAVDDCSPRRLSCSGRGQVSAGELSAPLSVAP